MAFVYVVEHGSTVGISGGFLTIKNKDNFERIPKDTIEGISIFSKSQMTSQCVEYCLENDIRVSFFNSVGKYYGSLVGTEFDNISRIKKQIESFEDEKFVLEIARKIVYAKVNNQLVVAKRYIRSKGGDTKERLFLMRDARRHSLSAENIKQLLGYEGIASRVYFKVLADLIDDKRLFAGRRIRPGNNPVNAMLNFGYSMLTKEITGEIVNRKLSPYVGLIHSGHDHMPALACDLIEEWRPIIIDSAVMGIIQGHEVSLEDFEMINGYCKMNQRVIKLLVEKIERHMYREQQYLSYISKPVSFRKAIWHQVDKMAKTVEAKNPNVYMPILIR